METKISYYKTYASSLQLVNLLKIRGLSVDHYIESVRYIDHIGYYRLSAYMYPLLKKPKANHSFKEGASFGQVMMLYRFDKKLRMFIFNEIEKIEIAVRSAIVCSGCEITGKSFWMTDESSYKDIQKYNHTMSLIKSEITHSREEFMVHFRQKYKEEYPPAWILAEILPFGVMTSLYSNLNNMRIKKRVAQKFGLQVAPFESWLTIITLTRNACCHHARVWNKRNSIHPMMPNHIMYPWISLPTDFLRIYFDLCIIKYFINIISPSNDMTAKLKELLCRFPQIDIAAMGFPKGWESEAVWN